MQQESKIKKVAAMTISVVVVEGELSALHSMGFPLPVLATLQEAKLHLQDACWDLKKSNSGISVSFFWPTVSTNCVAQAPPKRKKRRRRRRHKIANPSRYLILSVMVILWTKSIEILQLMLTMMIIISIPEERLLTEIPVFHHYKRILIQC